MQTDTQGYSLPGDSGSSTYERTPQELTAVSWAAFCTNIMVEEDATYRIQALDSDSLFDRLKLAIHMLTEKKDILKAKMEQAGITFRGNNNNGSGGGNGSDDKKNNDDSD